MLKFVYAGLSLAGAVLIPALCGISFWWVPLLAAGSFLALTLAHVLITESISLLIKLGKKPEHVSPFLRFWMLETLDIFLLYTLVKTHVEGELPSDGRFLLISNHLSVFDPVICLVRFRKSRIAFISKPENFKQPIIGAFMYRCRFLAIDRDDPRNAIRTIREAGELIASGETSIALYPEGTRSRSGELLPFKNGAFKIAQAAKCPIVVMTVSGTENIGKNLPFRSTDVFIRIKGTLRYGDFAHSSTALIAESVRALMLTDRPDTNKPAEL